MILEKKRVTDEAERHLDVSKNLMISKSSSAQICLLRDAISYPMGNKTGHSLRVDRIWGPTEVKDLLVLIRKS
jgi:hypothetical protein